MRGTEAGRWQRPYEFGIEDRLAQACVEAANSYPECTAEADDTQPFNEDELLEATTFLQNSAILVTESRPTTPQMGRVRKR